LRRADPCSALDCETTNGSGSRIFCPAREGHVGGNAADNRLFVEAVLYRYRTGIPWRDLACAFRDWKIRAPALQSMGEERRFRAHFKLLASDHDNEYMMIDATNRARSFSTAPAREKKRPASDRPISRWTDHQKFTRSSMPWAIPSAFDAYAQAKLHDLACAEPLIDKRRIQMHCLPTRRTTRTHSSDTLTQRGITPVIPPKANRKDPRACDFALYCERKPCRTVLQSAQTLPCHRHTYDKLARNFSPECRWRRHDPAQLNTGP